MISKKSCSICGSAVAKTAFEYNEPCVGEVKFSQVDYSHYSRIVTKCDLCGHYESSHNLDLSALYSGEYVSANYKDLEGIQKTFSKIVSLEPSKSDNYHRVKRIQDFIKTYTSRVEGFGNKALDVGSGLGVFPYAMKMAKWEITALDPDKTAATHMREKLGIPTIQGDFLKVSFSPEFDLVSFNKVLEHVENPIGMLASARAALKSKASLVYIELPDGELASRQGKDREEFFIDHLHVFSFASLAILARMAGFDVLCEERIREPSGKYTLYAFLVVARD